MRVDTSTIMSTSSDTLTIYLVRHAQSAGNVDMSLGSSTEPLTDLGKIQSNLLGMSLSHVKFDQAITSDSVRAACTSNGILRQSKDSTETLVKTENRLRECDFGVFEGKSYKEIMAYFVTLKKPPTKWDFLDGESLPQCGARFLSFIEELSEQILIKEKQSKTILLVSHTAAVVAFLNALYESEIHDVSGWDQGKDLKLMGNGKYMKFEVRTQSVENKSFSFTFVEKHASKHLACIEGGTGKSYGVAQFAKVDKSAKAYSHCIQQ